MSKSIVVSRLHNVYYRNTRKNIQCFPFCVEFGEYSNLFLANLVHSNVGVCRESVIAATCSDEPVIGVLRFKEDNGAPVGEIGTVYSQEEFASKFGKFVQSTDTLPMWQTMQDRLKDIDPTFKVDDSTQCIRFAPPCWNFDVRLSNGQRARKSAKFVAETIVFQTINEEYKLHSVAQSSAFEIRSTRTLLRKRQKAAPYKARRYQSMAHVCKSSEPLLEPPKSIASSVGSRRSRASMRSTNIQQLPMTIPIPGSQLPSTQQLSNSLNGSIASLNHMLPVSREPSQNSVHSLTSFPQQNPPFQFVPNMNDANMQQFMNYQIPAEINPFSPQNLNFQSPALMSHGNSRGRMSSFGLGSVGLIRDTSGKSIGSTQSNLSESLARMNQVPVSNIPNIPSQVQVSPQVTSQQGNSHVEVKAEPRAHLPVSSHQFAPTSTNNTTSNFPAIPQIPQIPQMPQLQGNISSVPGMFSAQQPQQQSQQQQPFNFQQQARNLGSGIVDNGLDPLVVSRVQSPQSDGTTSPFSSNSAGTGSPQTSMGGLSERNSTFEESIMLQRYVAQQKLILHQQQIQIEQQQRLIDAAYQNGNNNNSAGNSPVHQQNHHHHQQQHHRLHHSFLAPPTSNAQFSSAFATTSTVPGVAQNGFHQQQLLRQQRQQQQHQQHQINNNIPTSQGYSFGHGNGSYTNTGNNTVSSTKMTITAKLPPNLEAIRNENPDFGDSAGSFSKFAEGVATNVKHRDKSSSLTGASLLLQMDSDRNMDIIPLESDLDRQNSLRQNSLQLDESLPSLGSIDKILGIPKLESKKRAFEICDEFNFLNENEIGYEKPMKVPCYTVMNRVSSSSVPTPSAFTSSSATATNMAAPAIRKPHLRITPQNSNNSLPIPDPMLDFQLSSNSLLGDMSIGSGIGDIDDALNRNTSRMNTNNSTSNANTSGEVDGTDEPMSSSLGTFDNVNKISMMHTTSHIPAATTTASASIHNTTSNTGGMGRRIATKNRCFVDLGDEFLFTEDPFGVSVAVETETVFKSSTTQDEPKDVVKGCNPTANPSSNANPPISTSYTRQLSLPFRRDRRNSISSVHHDENGRPVQVQTHVRVIKPGFQSGINSKPASARPARFKHNYHNSASFRRKRDEIRNRDNHHHNSNQLFARRSNLRHAFQNLDLDNNNGNQNDGSRNNHTQAPSAPQVPSNNQPIQSPHTEVPETHSDMSDSEDSSMGESHGHVDELNDNRNNDLNEANNVDFEEGSPFNDTNNNENNENNDENNANTTRRRNGSNTPRTNTPRTNTPRTNTPRTGGSITPRSVSPPEGSDPPAISNSHQNNYSDRYQRLDSQNQRPQNNPVIPRTNRRQVGHQTRPSIYQIPPAERQFLAQKLNNSFGEKKWFGICGTIFVVLLLTIIHTIIAGVATISEYFVAKGLRYTFQYDDSVPEYIFIPNHPYIDSIILVFFALFVLVGYRFVETSLLQKSKRFTIFWGIFFGCASPTKVTQRTSQDGVWELLSVLTLPIYYPLKLLGYIAGLCMLITLLILMLPAQIVSGCRLYKRERKAFNYRALSGEDNNTRSAALQEPLLSGADSASDSHNNNNHQSAQESLRSLNQRVNVNQRGTIFFACLAMVHKINWFLYDASKKFSLCIGLERYYEASFVDALKPEELV